jgi:isoquinoline 1-oxidoreductase subunit beta
MTIAIKNGPELSRRAVLGGLGGLSFCLAVGDGLRLLPEAQASTGATQITNWVRIAPDGTITILTAGAEMGQGSMTTMPLIVAEEMDADWAKVAIEWAPADAKTYGYAFGNDRMMQIVGTVAPSSTSTTCAPPARRCARCSSRMRLRSGASTPPV